MQNLKKKLKIHAHCFSNNCNLLLATHQKVVWATILCFLGDIWKKDYEMEFQIIITNGLAIRMSDIIHDGGAKCMLLPGCWYGTRVSS